MDKEVSHESRQAEKFSHYRFSKSARWHRVLNQWSLTSLIFLIFSSSVFAADYYWIAVGYPGNFSSPTSACTSAVGSGSTFFSIRASAFQPAGTQYDCLYTITNTGDILHLTWASRQGDSCPSGTVFNIETGACERLPKNLGHQESLMTCRPINIGTGNKIYQVVDYQGSGNFPIIITRFYNSFAGQWSWIYQQKITVTGTSPRVATIHRPDGKQYTFTETTGNWLGDPDSTSRLLNDGQGFKYVLSDDTTESYDSNGRLTAITNRNGMSQTLVYGSNQVTINDVGESVVLSLDNDGQITTVNAGGNLEYRYGYKAAGLLEHIALPDSTLGQLGSNPFGEDNPFQTIHYENATYPDHVTGMTDENGNRTSTVQYDAQGRAIVSEIANGIEKTTLNYSQMDADDSRVTVTNELGKQTTYHFTTLHGVRKVTNVDGHQSANCAAANQNHTYDANGFKDLVTDWEGNVTDYDHDARGLEVQRIEAKGSPQQRTITTQWHSSFRLPVKITEPDRVIDFSYDASGLLLERKETPVP